MQVNKGSIGCKKPTLLGKQKHYLTERRSAAVFNHTHFTTIVVSVRAKIFMKKLILLLTVLTLVLCGCNKETDTGNTEETPAVSQSKEEKEPINVEVIDGAYAEDVTDTENINYENNENTYTDNKSNEDLCAVTLKKYTGYDWNAYDMSGQEFLDYVSTYLPYGQLCTKNGESEINCANYEYRGYFSSVMFYVIDSEDTFNQTIKNLQLYIERDNVIYNSDLDIYEVYYGKSDTVDKCIMYRNNLYIVITDFGHINKEYSVPCDVSRDYVLHYFDNFNHNVNHSEFYAIAEEYFLKYWGYTEDSWFDESMYVDAFEQYIVDNTNGEIGK